jgi:hypothetical protein
MLLDCRGSGPDVPINTARFLFSFNGKGIFFGGGFNAQASGGMSLWQRLCLRSFCKQRLKE